MNGEFTQRVRFLLLVNEPCRIRGSDRELPGFLKRTAGTRSGI